MVNGGKCQMCKGGFSRDRRPPLLLPSCGHSICRTCLTNLLRHPTLTCPSCREKQPKRSLDEYLVNHDLLALQESHKRGRESRESSQTRQPPANEDESCGNHGGARLAYYCRHCDAAACGECVIEMHHGQVHRSVKITQALEETRRSVQSEILQITAMLENTGSCETGSDGSSSSSFLQKFEEMKKELEAVNGKLKILANMLSLYSQDLKRSDRKMEEARMKLVTLQTFAPEEPEGYKGIKELLAYGEKVKELHKEVMEEGNGGENNLHISTVRPMLIGSRVLTTKLNTHAASLLYKVAGEVGREMVVEEAGGKVGCLRWEGSHLHLHCLRREGEEGGASRTCLNRDKKFHLKWAIIQMTLHEANTVFLDVTLSDNKQLRLYFQLNAKEPTSRCLLDLCVGMDISYYSILPLNTDLDPQENVANGQGVLIGVHHSDQETVTMIHNSVIVETSGVVTPVTSQTFKRGDIVGLLNHENKIHFWLMTKIEGSKAGAINNPIAAEETRKNYLHIASVLGDSEDITNLRLSRIVDCGILLCQNGSNVKPKSHIK